MSRHELTDEEIVNLLGQPRPFIPSPQLPELASAIGSRFFAQVKEWLQCQVDPIAVQVGLFTPETASDFAIEATEFFRAATSQHECWSFSSPQTEWNQLAGRAGYALVKGGTVTHVLVTIES